jgi:hypothetical protein
MSILNNVYTFYACLDIHKSEGEYDNAQHP